MRDNRILRYKYAKRASVVMALLAVCTIAAGAFVAFPRIARQYFRTPDVTVTINLANPIGTSRLIIGASHADSDVVLYGGRASVGRAKQVIGSSLGFENVPIMGWGSPDPEPSEGTYDWSGLDQRVQFMRSTGATKMITLCCAPGWMRDPSQSDDWDYLDSRPTKEHFQDFAALAQKVALRYPDVQYFQVWNELKGFFNDSANTWDYESYTTLYNMVYDAIKAVRPDAKIGGPYVALDTWASPDAGGWPAKDPTLRNQSWGTVDQRELDVISYWLANKHGADFIILDGGTGTREGKWITDDFTAANFFSAVMNWLRKQPNGGATLPVGWAEWYPSTSYDGSDINHYNAVLAHDLITTLQSGSWYALLWQTQGDSRGLNAYPASFMTSAGRPTVEYNTLTAFKDYFGPGTAFYGAKVSTTTITVLASGTKTLLVNHVDYGRTVSVNGQMVSLAPYGVTLINTPHST